MKYNDFKSLEIMVIINDPVKMFDLVSGLEEKQINNNINVLEDLLEAKKIIFRESGYSKAILPDILFIDDSVDEDDVFKFINKIGTDDNTKKMKIFIKSDGNKKISKYLDRISICEDEINPNTILDCINEISDDYYLCAVKVNKQDKIIKNRVKILIIEDNPGDMRLMEEMLKDLPDMNFELKKADNLEDGIEYLKTGGIDLMFLDLSLPNVWGINTFLQVTEINSKIPIIVLTGLNDKEIAIKTVKKGAQDYLIKDDVEPNILEKSIRYAIERNRILLELEDKKNELEVSKKNFKNIIEKTDSGIVVINQNKIIQYVNSTYEVISNEHSQDLIGEKFEYNFFVGQVTQDKIQNSNKKIELKTEIIKWEGENAFLIYVKVKDNAEEEIKRLENKLDAVIQMLKFK